MAVVLVSVDKGRVTARVRDLLIDARAAAGIPATSARVMQGSYSTGVSASAGTHAGGGAFDLSIAGLSTAQQVALVTELRRRRACAWIRTKPYGWNGDPHIHGIVRDEPGVSAAAKKQVQNYDAGNNSLAGASRQKDTLPRPKQYPMEEFHMAPVQTFKHGSMYKTPLAKPLKLTARKAPYDIAVVDLPAGKECLLTFQVRTLKNASLPDLEVEFVRLGWGEAGQATDETGHNPIPPATKSFGVWHRWRTVNHAIKGGGKLAFRVYIPEGASGDYRFVCKSDTV